MLDSIEHVPIPGAGDTLERIDLRMAGQNAPKYWVIHLAIGVEGIDVDHQPPRSASRKFLAMGQVHYLSHQQPVQRCHSIEQRVVIGSSQPLIGQGRVRQQVLPGFVYPRLVWLVLPVVESLLDAEVQQGHLLRAG